MNVTLLAAPAVSKTNPTNPPPALPAGLIESLAAAATQSQAAGVLAKSLVGVRGIRSVRVGVGDRSLRCLYDGRFGRVAGDSALHDECAASFNKDQSTFVSDEVDGRRIAIWIDGAGPTPAGLAGAAAVVLSRPRLGWSSKFARRLSVMVPHRIKIAAAVGLLAAVAAWPVPHAVDGRATIVAHQSRVLAAPFEAVLAEIHVRPGDRVSAGDPIVRLDGYRLRMEQQKLTAELQQAIKDRDIAMASRQIAGGQLAALRRDSLRRQLDLTERRLSQLVLTSPIDGVVLRGDLSRHVGTPLEMGQTVVEIVPTGSLRAEVAVAEIDRPMIAADDALELRFAAAGGVTRSRIERIWPAAEIRDDQNVFVAVAAMPTDGVWSPGMIGTAVIDGPTRPLAWRWLRGPTLAARQWIGW